MDLPELVYPFTKILTFFLVVDNLNRANTSAWLYFSGADT